MKFTSYRADTAMEHVFSIIVGEGELCVENERQFRMLASRILDRLSNMIAAYYFKRHKTAFDEFLSSPEIRSLIAEKLAERLEVSIRS